MKDYLVHAEDHRYEVTCITFRQAQSQAASFRREGLEDITIDQYEDNELTGVYWTYGRNQLKNRLVRHS